MTKWVFLSLFLFVILVGIWFWSLGRLTIDDTPRIVLSETSGEVQLKSGADNTFVPIGPGAELSVGDILKTGKDSTASLDFYGESQSRLDSDTELTILAADPAAGVSSGIRLKLEAGRMWSRVLRILDLDKVFSIETSDVVATVRGTAFGLEKLPGSSTKIFVSDSVVEANGTGAAMGRVFIPQFSAADFTAGRRTTTTEPITSAVLIGKWFRQNQESDRRFVAKRLEKLRGSLSLDRLPRPGIMREIALGSEAIRERIGSLSRREAATRQVIVRRLGLIRSEIDRGNLGSASREFAEFERVLKARLANADVSASHLARSALGIGLRLFEDIRPGQDGYGLKQQILDLMVTSAKSSGEQAAARLMAIDTHLDESATMIFQLGDFEAGKTAALVALSSIQNTEREALAMNLTELEREAVEHILEAFRIRAEDLLKSNPQATPTIPPAISPTAAPTSTIPVIEPPVIAQVVTTTTPEPSVPTCVSLRLLAQPNPVSVGGQAILSVQATLANGSSQDMTSQAVYTLYGDLGILQRNVFTARAAGSVRIEVSLACQAGNVRQSVDLQIVEPVRVQSLTLEPSLSRLTYGESAVFRAIITYSSGLTREVSGQSTYSLTNTQLGRLSGNVFTSAESDGTLRLMASYQENGVTVTGGADIIITAQ